MTTTAMARRWSDDNDDGNGATGDRIQRRWRQRWRRTTTTTRLMATA
jgi:hypothetical protein